MYVPVFVVSGTVTDAPRLSVPVSSRETVVVINVSPAPRSYTPLFATSV